MHVCMSVCVYVGEHNSKDIDPIYSTFLHKICYNQDSVLLKDDPIRDRNSITQFPDFLTNVKLGSKCSLDNEENYLGSTIIRWLPERITFLLLTFTIWTKLTFLNTFGSSGSTLTISAKYHKNVNSVSRGYAISYCLFALKYLEILL